MTDEELLLWLRVEDTNLTDLAAPDLKPTFYFDRYINGVKMAEDVCVERASSLSAAMVVASKIASRGPNGEAPVLVYRPSPLAEALEKILSERGAVFDAMVDAAEDAAGKDVSFNVVIGRALRAALAEIKGESHE